MSTTVLGQRNQMSKCAGCPALGHTGPPSCARKWFPDWFLRDVGCFKKKKKKIQGLWQSCPTKHQVKRCPPHLSQTLGCPGSGLHLKRAQRGRVSNVENHFRCRYPFSIKSSKNWWCRWKPMTCVSREITLGCRKTLRWLLNEFH